MDNQLLARTLFTNNLATEAQIRDNWSFITPEKDIAKVLVEKGILQEQVYNQLIEFVNGLDKPQEQQAATENSASAETSSVEAAQESTPEQATTATSTEVEEEGSEVPTQDASEIAKNTREGGEEIEIEGNNPYGDGANIKHTSPLPVNPVEGLEATSIANYGKKSSSDATEDTSEDASEEAAEKDGVLPEVGAGSRGAGQLHVRKVQSADDAVNIDELLVYSRWNNISDIYLDPGKPVVFRQFHMVGAGSDKNLEDEHIRMLVIPLLDENTSREFRRSGSICFGYSIKGAGRFRVTLVDSAIGWSCHIRIVSSEIFKPSELGLPKSIGNTVLSGNGLILVSGHAASGKTTTLSALANHFNYNRQHTMSIIGRPLETILQPYLCYIIHREVGVHSRSKEEAIQASIDLGVSVLVVDSIENAAQAQLILDAANAGILVLASISASNSLQALSRLLSFFPVEDRERIQEMLASSLKCVLNQTILPKADKSGMVAAYEVMPVTNIVASRIRTANLLQIYQDLASNKKGDYISQERFVQDLHANAIISDKTAEEYKRTSSSNQV